MKKNIIVAILVIAFQQIYAQSSEKTYYVSTNILSPLSGLNKNSSPANALLPVFSNMEYGLTLSGGYFKSFHFVETRLTLGKSNEYNIIPQIQLNYNFLISDYFKKNGNGFYVGGSLRYWDYINTYTSTQNHNLAPGVNIGYVWKKKHFLFDIRMNQNFAILSASNIENTKPAFEFSLSPMPGLSPVLPFFSFNLGYKF